MSTDLASQIRDAWHAGHPAEIDIALEVRITATLKAEDPPTSAPIGLDRGRFSRMQAGDDRWAYRVLVPRRFGRQHTTFIADEAIVCSNHIGDWRFPADIIEMHCVVRHGQEPPTLRAEITGRDYYG